MVVCIAVDGVTLCLEDVEGIFPDVRPKDKCFRQRGSAFGGKFGRGLRGVAAAVLTIAVARTRLTEESA